MRLTLSGRLHGPSPGHIHRTHELMKVPALLLAPFLGPFGERSQRSTALYEWQISAIKSACTVAKGESFLSDERSSKYRKRSMRIFTIGYEATTQAEFLAPCSLPE